MTTPGPLPLDDVRGTRLDIPGTSNIRDLGGYPAAEGQRIRRGCFLRSEALALPGASEVHAIWDDGNAALLRAIGLRTVVDLRTDVETATAPSAWHDATGADVVSMPVLEGGEGSDTDVMRELLDGTRAGISPADLGELYVGLLERRGEVIGAVVRVLADPDRAPVLVHCSAGKDRTGVVVAVVLDALGVDRELVVADYELTGRLRPDRVRHYRNVLTGAGVDPESARVLFETPAEAMRAALGHLDRAHGGAAGYLLDHAGLTPRELEALRTHLLTES